jgi:DUF1365 family protein
MSFWLLALGALPPLLLIRFFGMKYLRAKMRPSIRGRHRIYLATTIHARFQPISHSFRYPLFYAGIYVNQVTGNKVKGVPSWLFAVDRPALFSIRTRDYLQGKDSRSLHDKLFELLKQSVCL